MNLHMIRAIRLVNSQQKGLPVADFMAALEDANRSDAFDELMRRRGRRVWLNGLGGYLSGLGLAEKMDLFLSGSALGNLVVPSLFSDPDAMAVIAASPEIMADIAASAELMTGVLSSAVAVTAIYAVPAAKSAIMASTALTVASVPPMTSDTSPTGVVSASSLYGGYPAFSAFDKNAGTFWAGGAGQPNNQWLQYSFPGQVFISGATATCYAPPHNPINCRIECSHDGIGFDIAKTFVMASGASNTIPVEFAGFYKHWRLFMENVSGTSHPGIYELNFTGFVKP